MNRFSKASFALLQPEIGIAVAHSSSYVSRITELFGPDLRFTVSQDLVEPFLLRFVGKLRIKSILSYFDEKGQLQLQESKTPVGFYLRVLEILMQAMH